MKRLIAVLLMLTLCLTGAAAEETLGNLADRGITIAITEADLEAGYGVVSYQDYLPPAYEQTIPAIAFEYTSPLGYEALAKAEEFYSKMEYQAFEEAFEEYSSHYYVLTRIYLVSNDEEKALLQADDPSFIVLGENDGYTYLLANYPMEAREGDDPAAIEAAEARFAELVETIAYQPVVLSESDMVQNLVTEVPNAFPAFTTQDLNGNTVDNSIFAQKDLTVLNIWGTTCYPCISEMPELAAWSEEMPDNVQIIGLVGDVAPGNTEYIEMAQMICEATGVNFVNLINTPDLKEFMSNIIFTPTTIFVDRKGAVVGEPITGAQVDQYKAFVEEYINAQ